MRRHTPSLANTVLGFGFIALVGTHSSSAYGQSRASGHDFIDDARLFANVVACSGEGTRPASFDQAARSAIDAHCLVMTKKIQRFRKRYVRSAQRFFAKRLPRSLPTSVVYPFGGGDLVSALITYPKATEITTISLENAGDPRRLRTLLSSEPSSELESSLRLFSLVGGELLKWHDSASKNLRKMEKGPVPGQLSLFLLALSVFDYEPLSLRYFRIEPDGSLHYLTLEEVNAVEDTLATRLEKRWIDPDYSIAFRNSELTFRKRGDASAPIITHRHIAWNLNNKNFNETALHKHLQAKGKIAAMTKAASFLLWMGNFSKIRRYLLRHMRIMVSDATGILPRHAERWRFEQITYGTFDDAFLVYAQGKNSAAMAELWLNNPKRRLPFRYGYPDAHGNVHLMITRPRRRRRKRPVRPTSPESKLQRTPAPAIRAVPAAE